MTKLLTREQAIATTSEIFVDALDKFRDSGISEIVVIDGVEYSSTTISDDDFTLTVLFKFSGLVTASPDFFGQQKIEFAGYVIQHQVAETAKDFVCNFD